MEKSRISFRNLNLLLIFILPILFLIFGIKKQNEIHEKLMIQGIGIDLDDENRYKVTVQAHDFKNPESKNEPKVRITENTGQTVSEALENLKNITGLYPLYSQNKIIILGKKAAKQGSKNIIDFFLRYYENRPSVKLRVAKELAEDILKFKVNDKNITSSEIKDLADEESDINILKFEENEREQIDSAIMIVEEEQNKLLKSKNFAIFHNGKLSNFLNNSETLGTKILKGNSKLDTYNFYMNENLISCKLENSKTKLIPKINDDIISIDIEININYNLLEAEHDFKNIEEMESKIKPKLDENLSKICEETLKNTLSKGHDLFSIGKLFKKKYPKYFKKNQEIWNNQVLPNISYNIKIDSKLSMIGLNKS